jgi:23S rRNA pseudouridine955/2504/2580 synthase
MQKIVVKTGDDNIKLEKYILSKYPNLSYGTLQKAFRKKDIKVNGKRVDKDFYVKSGDEIEIYIIDDLLNGSASRPTIPGNNLASSGNSDINFETMDTPDNPGTFISKGSANKPKTDFTIVYEDENVLIVNKAQGIPVHPDKDQADNTLIDQVRMMLDQRNDSTGKNCLPQGENCPHDSFQPSLCHRLDRNTGGLVIIAKNRESHDVLLQKIEDREIRKYYKCLVKGRMEKHEAQLKAYLWKDARKSRVFVSSQKSKGSLEIITAYKVLEYDPEIDVSMLEVELITGRTHQIRAHLAFIGHPIIGDGKYGSNAINRTFGLKKQALWAYKINFNFKGKSCLDYLNGKVISAEPEFSIKSLYR